MVATAHANLRLANSTNVRTGGQVERARPKTVPETLSDLLDWFVDFSGLGVDFSDVDFELTAADVEGDLSAGRED